jgi:dTDP-4-dehydrorhamnose reductase
MQEITCCTSDVCDAYPHYERTELAVSANNKLSPAGHHFRVIILGANGMLGRYVHKLYALSNMYQNIIPITRSDFDFGQSSDVVHNYLLNLIQSNDLIVNCIGMINKRDSSSPEAELQFYRINAVLPRLLAQTCAKNGGFLIHITTDCVFDGSEGWMCRTDQHNSIDLYGMTKSLGDYSIRGYPMVSIIRTSIIGEESNGRSLVEWVINSSTETGTINGYTNHMWNGITCLELAKIIVYGMRIPSKNPDHKYGTQKNPIYNSLFFGKEMIITSGNAINKYDLVKLIAEIYNVDVTIIPLKHEIDRNMQLSGIIRSKDSIREQILKMKEFDVLDRRLK